MKMLQLLLLMSLFSSVVCGSFMDKLQEAADITKELAAKVGVQTKVENMVDWISYHSGLGEQCEFNENPSKVVRKILQTHLRAQERAMEAVVSAIEAWEFARAPAKARTPLLLAITGPTGTGKTETSNLIAEGLFKHKIRLKNSDKQIPSGLLVFRGEDFNDNYTNPITEYHEQIKRRLVDHLTWCSGKAVVVFDEVQKVIPHTLDVLLEAVSSRPVLTYYKDGISRKIDCSNVIFILVSDIGADRMQKILMAHGSRSEVPQAELVLSVKDALDAQWKRLQFGKMVNEVIPFLPLEEHHIQEIIELKLDQMHHAYKGKYWKSLQVKGSVSEHMAQTRYVKYMKHQANINGQVRMRVYAKYGARNVEKSGPLQRLRSKLFRYLHPWNPDADITISLVGSEISIDSCYELKRDNAKAPAQMLEYTCAQKWKGSL